MPHYDELSVKKLWPNFSKDPNFTRYFPSKLPKDKLPDREYFFNVLNTLEGDYLAQVMHHANEQRLAAFGKGQEKEAIVITEFWQEQLK